MPEPVSLKQCRKNESYKNSAVRANLHKIITFVKKFRQRKFHKMCRQNEYPGRVSMNRTISAITYFSKNSVVRMSFINFNVTLEPMSLKTLPLEQVSLKQ